MVKVSIIIPHYNNQDILSHKIVSGFNPNLENWVWIIVSDLRNQTSISAPQVLKNNPPTKPSLSLYIDENENLDVNWTENFDNDFKSYQLYHSQNPDMKNKNLVIQIFLIGFICFSQKIQSQALGTSLILSKSNVSFDKLNFTPSFLSKETEATLSTEFKNNFKSISNFF